MEAYCNSQTPSLIGMQYKDGAMSMPGPGMNHIAGYQAFELPPAFNTFISRSATPSEADHGLQSPEVYQILNLDSTVPSSAAASPLLSTLDSREGRDVESQKHQLQIVKRRAQNRDAQRRFRGRKEERHQTLQQRATELEARCKELLEGFNQKSEEISKILKEKEALTSEIKDLRKRWRLMVMLLQLPNRLQSLSCLLGGDLPSTSGLPLGSSSPPPATKPEPLEMPVEDLFGCLQELLLPDEALHSQSPLCSSS